MCDRRVVYLFYDCMNNIEKIIEIIVINSVGLFPKTFHKSKVNDNTRNIQNSISLILILLESLSSYK